MEISIDGFNLDKLVEHIASKVSEQLEEKQQQQAVDHEYLSRDQVAKMLRISLPTLHDWCKKGILQSYRLGKRVYFKSQEVEEAMKRINYAI